MLAVRVRLGRKTLHSARRVNSQTAKVCLHTTCNLWVLSRRIVTCRFVGECGVSYQKILFFGKVRYLCCGMGFFRGDGVGAGVSSSALVQIFSLQKYVTPRVDNHLHCGRLASFWAACQISSYELYLDTQLFEVGPGAWWKISGDSFFLNSSQNNKIIMIENCFPFPPIWTIVLDNTSIDGAPLVLYWVSELKVVSGMLLSCICAGPLLCIAVWSCCL